MMLMSLMSVCSYFTSYVSCTSISPVSLPCIKKLLHDVVTLPTGEFWWLSFLVKPQLNPIYTIQPVIKPVVQWFDNRLYRVNKHPNQFDNRVERTAAVRSTGCQTALYNRFDNRLSTRYSRLSKRLSNGLCCVYKHLTGLTTSLTTGCMV